jgi:hypothetical protein
MDINIGETPAGRLKMELFSDIVPKLAGFTPRSLRWLIFKPAHNPGQQKTSDNYAPENTGNVPSSLNDLTKC